MNEALPPSTDYPAPPIVYRDRRTGMILFGIGEIALGVLCLLLAAVMVLGQAMVSHNTGTPISLRLIIPSVLFYGIIAIGLISLGIGSIQCRRWARALLLVLSWFWLVVGVLSVPMMAWILPRVLSNPQPGGQQIPQQALIVIVTVQILIIGVFFILVPGALVLFYRSPHVKSTCETRDPQPRWTDRCPLPVLAVACLACFGSAMMLIMALSGLGVLPFFGMFLSGWSGIASMIALAVLALWIGRSWYRLNPAGWWAVLLISLVFSISNILTFARVDIMEMYEKMGYPQEQLDLMRQYNWMDGRTVMWMSILSFVPFLGYLLWTKRYFGRASADVS